MFVNSVLFLADSEDDMVVVLTDYPSPEISEPIYRMGEKLRVTAQYASVFTIPVKPFETVKKDSKKRQVSFLAIT